MKQRTLLKSGTISGIGLHTGEKSVLSVLPAPTDSGIRFQKNGRELGSLPELLEAGQVTDDMRCTAIGSDSNRVLTLEHFLSAVNGLGITNLTVNVQGEEIPGLDGSAGSWVRFLKDLGFKDEDADAYTFRLKEPIFVADGARAICALPYHEFKIGYVLDYDHPALKNQLGEWSLSPAVFEAQIAPARTFCTDAESRTIREKGLGKGANYTNTLVMTAEGPVENSLRFENEPVRHKILDILGDLMFTGFPIEARIIGIRSGHALNARLVREIIRQKREAS